LVKNAHENMNKQEAPEPKQALPGSQFSPPAGSESLENGGGGQKIEPAKASGDVSGQAHADSNGGGSDRRETGSPSLGYTENPWPRASTPLAATDVAAADPGNPAIQAHVDGIDSRGNITGWGWVPQRPEQRLDVNAYIGEEVVSFGTANLPRADVKEAGYGDGSYGFSLPLSDAMLDGKPRPFSIRFEATGAESVALDAELRPPFRAVRGLSTPLKPGGPLPSSPAAPAGGITARGAAVYVPGQYVICSTPYPQPPYHTDGWYEPEEEFTWIRGGEGVIEMLLRRPLGSYIFTLEVVPNGVGGRLQTLEIFFNYFRVGFFEIAEPRTVSVELPAEIFILRKTRINLHCRNAVTPSDHGVPDDRRLGIAVSGWCII
jgi:hypothetical protein